jgi:hypothetical protein
MEMTNVLDKGPFFHGTMAYLGKGNLHCGMITARWKVGGMSDQLLRALSALK